MQKPHALLMAVPMLLLVRAVGGALGQGMPPMDGRFILLLVIVAIALLLIFKAGGGGAGRAAHITRTCRECGATHPGFARFCRRCGKKL